MKLNHMYETCSHVMAFVNSRHWALPPLCVWGGAPENLRTYHDMDFQEADDIREDGAGVN